MSEANLPRQQGAARARLEMFAKVVGENAAMYCIPPALAAELQAATDSFDVAFDAGNPKNPRRSRVDVFTKDQAFAVAERVYRQTYSMIKWNDDVPETAKILAGVRPVNRERVKRDLPFDVPVLGARLGIYGQHVVTYAVADVFARTMVRLAKPAAVAQLQLFVAITDKPVHDPNEARICGCYTRNPCLVMYKPDDGGKFASYFGRWVSHRGKLGRFSAPISMRIAA